MNDSEPFDSTPYDPFAAPRAPHPEPKTMTLDEAYWHLYQIEPHPWEDRAEYEARKIAREGFEKNLAEQGLTIQALVAMGQIKQSTIDTTSAASPLFQKLMKRI